eukprot:g2438.t1
MHSWQQVGTVKTPSLNSENLDIEKQALFICRSYGAGSEQYRIFLDEINASSTDKTRELPKFVPGDIRTSTQTKKNRRRRQKTNRPPLPQTPQGETNKTECSTPERTSPSSVDTPIGAEKPEVQNERPVMIKSRTRVSRKTENVEERARALRRTQSTFPSEQFTMDEQVALQLQSLLREKAELLKENSRLKNENAGLHELLQYATCESTVDEGECSDYEEMAMGLKDGIRYSGIQAWHPSEFYNPDSASSIGLGSASSTDEKETQVMSVNQLIPDAFQLST